MDEEEIKSKLTPEQYKVLRQKGTEMPFTGKYVHPPSPRLQRAGKTKDGNYVCIVCESPLFSSNDQFDSGQTPQSKYTYFALLAIF